MEEFQGASPQAELKKKEGLKPLEVAACSVASEKHPDQNEDTFFTTSKSVGIFDGLGGAPSR